MDFIGEPRKAGLTAEKGVAILLEHVPESECVFVNSFFLRPARVQFISSLVEDVAENVEAGRRLATRDQIPEILGIIDP